MQLCNSKVLVVVIFELYILHSFGIEFNYAYLNLELLLSTGNSTLIVGFMAIMAVHE